MPIMLNTTSSLNLTHASSTSQQLALQTNLHLQQQQQTNQQQQQNHNSTHHQSISCLANNNLQIQQVQNVQNLSLSSQQQSLQMQQQINDPSSPTMDTSNRNGVHEDHNLNGSMLSNGELKEVY